jgi:hypothetical protein
MHIYMAAVYSNSYMPGMNRYVKLNDREREVLESRPHILESWHYVGKQAFVDHMRANGAQIFLDSGAFSAFTLGVELSVDEYCNYIKKNEDIIRKEDGILMASVLDGIGDALKTYRNQLEMEARGVKPLPCFHFGEDMRYLDYYVENYEYITLGGMVGATTEQLSLWLSKVWESKLIDGAGRAKLKVHGFGITSVPLMEDFDWYSCDSSSWIQSAAFGTVIMPGASRSKPAWPIAVSTKSPSKHDYGQHITTLSDIEIEHLDTILGRSGFNKERLGEVYESRAAYNLWAFGEVNVTMDERRRQCYLAGKQIDLYGNVL